MTEPPSRTRQVVALVVTAGIVSAVAAGRLQLLQLPADLDSTAGLWPRLIGIVLAVGGLGFVFVQRRALWAMGERNPDPTVVAFRTGAAILGVVTLLALTNPPEPVDVEAPSFGSGFDLSRTPFGDRDSGEVLPAETRGGESLISGDELDDLGAEPPTLVVEEETPSLVRRLVEGSYWLFLLAGAMLVLRFLVPRKQRTTIRVPEAPSELDPAVAAEGLEASLDELEDLGGDPRDQITMAYRRLLRALREAGAERRSCEAPHEHLHRTLGPLGVGPEPLHRLAGLYVIAHFGQRPMTDRDRLVATESLELSLTGLDGV